MTLTQQQIMEFTPADQLKKGYPKREDARFVCSMCGAEVNPLCDTCLKELVGTMVESVLEQLVKEGKIDGALQRVLDRRVARGDVPREHEDDHELIDQVSGEIRDG